MPNNSRETEKLNNEIERHDEIFKALAELTSAVRSLEKQVKEFEPAMDYINKGSIIAKFLLFIIKWASGAVVTMGAVAGAWIVIKAMFHAQN